MKTKAPIRMLPLYHIVEHIRRLNPELSKWLAESFIEDGIVEIPPAYSHLQLGDTLYLHPDVLDWLHKTKGLAV